MDNPRTFEMLPQDRVVHGTGSVALLGEQLDQLGVERALIVTGTTLATETDLVDRLRDHLGPRCAGVFSGTVQHVPARAVFGAADAARACDADGIVSFGGGTPIDTAKGAILVLAEDVRTEGDLAEHRVQYRYGGPMHVPPVAVERVLPHVAVPTTISGGEYSHGFTVKDESTGTKHVFLGGCFVPDVVILDPAVTLATPESLWLSTGVRSVDHAVESYLSRFHHPLTDALAKPALESLLRNLPRCKRSPDDLDVRHELQLASWLSIFQVIPNVRFGLSHALGHQIGGRFDIPHGVTSCILLPHVLAFNATVNADRQAELARAVGVAAPDADPKEGADALQQAVRDLVTELGLPSRIRDFGVDRADLAPVATVVMGDLIVETNPRCIESEAEVLEILELAW